MGQFDTSVGPMLLGFIFNTYLYGLVTSQYLHYWSLNFNDPTWIEMMVGILCVVDTTHSIVAIYEAWRMCVTNFNMPESLRFVDWAVPFTSIATSLSALVTQIFLGHRVFQLTKSKPLIAVLAVLCLGSFVFGCIAGIKAYVIREIADFGPLIPLVIARFSLLSCADLLIVVVLIYALSRSKTDFRRTDKIINSLIRNAIQSGLLVTIVSLGDLFLFAFFSSTNLYSLFVYPLGRIYTSTLLYTLNARMTLFRMEQNTEGLTWRAGLSQVHAEFPGLPEGGAHARRDVFPLQKIERR